MDNSETILVVEDERDMREALVEACELLTPNILIASNGEEAIKLIKENKITTIVSDLSMPVMNGFQLLNEVRRQGLQTPFVFVTAHGQSPTVKEAFRMGAQDLLEKPFFIDDLLDVIGRNLYLGKLILKGEKHKSATEISKTDSEKQTVLQKFKKILFKH